MVCKKNVLNGWKQLPEGRYPPNDRLESAATINSVMQYCVYRHLVSMISESALIPNFLSLYYCCYHGNRMYTDLSKCYFSNVHTFNFVSFLTGYPVNYKKKLKWTPGEYLQ